MLVYTYTCLLFLQASLLLADAESFERQSIEPRMLHLRSGTEREWIEFPEIAQRQRLDVTFDSTKNTSEHTLVMRQQDVKQNWSVTLNGKKLGELARDENDMIVTFAIPIGILVDGVNSLTIAAPASSATTSDDIRIGELTVLNRSVQTTLCESSVEFEVVDADSKELLPCRITVLNANGAMQAFGTVSSELLAVRTGTAYTANGQASLKLPAGRYTVFAGRGFEYSLARAEVQVGTGETVKSTLTIRREVSTEGYIACDTHIHTVTHSHHGDATLDERMVTLAGEGIEFPIATDHNKHIDYESAAARIGVRRYFTPVIGNEVTTPRGHFNIFPITAQARVVDHTQTDWRLLFDAIQQTQGVKVCILNHARDLHSGVRPFGPDHHNALIGENLDDWPMRFNAMEILNSGATQSDPLQLSHDWMGLLNRGLNVTPVGSSDSHDVSRYIVGQGRTYIRCDDRDPGKLDIDSTVASFVEGRVMVSYGLLTELTVNERYRSGELATEFDDGEVRIDVKVSGPHWAHADHVQLFANGHPIRNATIPETNEAKLPLGTKWIGRWTIPKQKHDVHLVAIATGKGVEGQYWRMAKPYQPVRPEWESRSFGCSGVVWLDIDRDGQRTSARDYAQRLLVDAGNDWERLVASLSDYDEAVASQAAHLVNRSGTSPLSEPLQKALLAGTSATKFGFQTYREAWRASEIARAKR